MDRSMNVSAVAVAIFGASILALGYCWLDDRFEQAAKRERAVVAELRRNAKRQCQGDTQCVARVLERAERCVRSMGRYRVGGKQVRELVGIESVPRFYACLGIGTAPPRDASR